jgi:hypothetical protein
MISCKNIRLFNRHRLQTYLMLLVVALICLGCGGCATGGHPETKAEQEEQARNERAWDEIGSILAALSIFWPVIR